MGDIVFAGYGEIVGVAYREPVHPVEEGKLQPVAVGDHVGYAQVHVPECVVRLVFLALLH